jgi:flagellar FliJ protein
MAKKFKFRLDPILKIRSEKVEKTKNFLNIAVRNRYEKEYEIEKLNNVKKEFLSKQQTYTKAVEMQTAKDYVNNIDMQLKKKDKEKEKLLEIEEQRRNQLNEALQEEKVIVKLKEKKLTEYQQQLYKEETNFLDEIGTNQFINNFK